VFLKTLTLKGFKSFADATSLDMEPGVTVVVGPNGSGKSNVVDAIAWVLGAQAPSAVRSQKMDDVIFAGTASRPALGRAEVSLTIDNQAGLLPIEFSEVTITRTLWRSGESEYAINGSPCRMLDIQELLSDSGVGRQQHVIISQGQIDAVLNARPEDRRLIIEEAAGILKYRRRKEKAERRLQGTEANLLRLQDLLREIRRQLRPLERQAEAARRHGALADELQTLRVYVAGLDLGRLRRRLDTAEGARRDLRASEGDAKAQLARLDTEVMAAESRLAALGGDDVGDDLARGDALRERARGLAAVLAERDRGLQRQLGSSVDEAVVASLDAEAAQLADELAAVVAEREALEPERRRWEDDDRAVAAERAAVAAALADGAPADPADDAAAPPGRAAEVRAELGALRGALDRAEGERRRAEERRAVVTARLDRLAGEVDALAAERDRLRTEMPGRTDDAERTRRDVEAAEVAAGAAIEHRRAADGDAHRWSARAEALALALDEARAQAGAARLSDVAGVLGTVLDLVAVDDGWEAAFEAAAGPALGAVVVDGPAGARRAVESLTAEKATGAVIPLRPAGAGATTLGSTAPGSLRGRVRALRPDVEPLLDALLAGVVAVDSWPEAVDRVTAPGADPGLVVVTRHGDRFAADGWRIGTGGAGATGAALAEAREQVERSEEEAVAAAEAAEAARRALDAARSDEQTARRELDRARTRSTAVDEALRRMESDRADLAAEIASLDEQRSALTDAAARDRAEADRLAGELPALEADEDRRAEAARAAAAARAELDDRAAAVAATGNELRVRVAGLEERRQLLAARRAEVEERLSRYGAERAAAEARRVALERQARAVGRFAAIVDGHRIALDRTVDDLRARRRQQSDAARAVASELEAARKRRAEVERSLTETRERLQRAEIDVSEVTVRIEAAVEAMRRDLDVDPDAALAVPEPELPEGTTAPARVRDLERELRLLGPINPLALEEFTALQERHTHTEAQLDDVKSARRDLAKVIRAVDEEIVSVFAAAYADVESNFRQLFETLFPGGRGRLKLTDPDDLLTTGIEVEARPSGKNVKKLSLLSGGERSLTALAYLFSVFRARPSPFYVMDEVEAALDDVNLHRFLGLVTEFRDDAQLIIVSHQKRTMEAADLLYGVTMKPGGSSQVVSEKVGAGT